MRRHKARALLLALAALAAAAGLAPFAPAFAQDAPDPARLDAVERDLKASESENRRLTQEAEAAARAMEKMRDESIALAADVQDQEYSLLAIENRITALDADAARAGAVLGRRDQQMREALLALQRLALRPADALTLNPLSPDDAVRTAILLRAALPNITQSAATLQAELAALYGARAAAAEQRAQAARAAAALTDKRKRLEALLEQKAAQRVKAIARADEAGARARRLAQEAEDLRALFAKLAEEKARREAEERAAREAARKLAEAKAAAEREAAARVAPPAGRPGTDDVAVTRSFAKARGTMPAPVAGTLSARYGEAADAADTAGLRTKGLTIKAAAGAQVVAPFDGLIAFAGPFRGYGQLLIIEHSEGYHTLLAGLGRIDGEVGSRVLAGEPVGVMAGDAGATSLYVELRRDGQPINPLPWLADRTGKIARN